MLYALLLASPPAAALTLEEAWSAAEERGVARALIHEQRVSSDALKTQALALVSPKLVLGANYTINEREVALDFADSIPEEFKSFFEGSEPIVVNKKQYLDWNASIIQPIFSGVALPAYNAAVNTVRAGRAQEEASVGDLRFGVAQIWWGLLLADEGERVASDAVENARKHLRIATAAVAAGTAAPATRLRAELAQAQAERQLAVAKEQAGRVRSLLQDHTGLVDLAPTRPTSARALPYDSVEAAVSRAMEQRADLVAARFQATAARQILTARHLAWLPSVDGRFTESYTENSGFSGEPYNWQLVFMANWVLWDGGARVAEQNIAASQRRMAELNVRHLEESADTTVRAAWAEHARAGVAVSTVAKELELATENLRLSEAAFEAGTISFLDVEDARLGLAASRMAVLQEQMSQDLAALALLVATGDL